jgi:adenosylcobinamide-phosphate synthase
MKVYDALQEGDLEKSRYAVSMVVGRDTAVLDDIGVTKAAVETVAENTSDGIIAPLLYMVIGGAPLGFFYKAVNTMDSMVGYKNDRYLYFGRAAAKFDDVVNYIPARLSAILMTVAAGICGMDAKNAWRIYKRDRYNHSSPNSAHTEAVTAGALHVQLAGNAYYFGKLYEKPTLGDADRPVEYEDIRRANQLLYGTAILALIIFSMVKGVILWIL